MQPPANSASYRNVNTIRIRIWNNIMRSGVHGDRFRMYYLTRVYLDNVLTFPEMANGHNSDLEIFIWLSGLVRYEHEFALSLCCRPKASLPRKTRDRLQMSFFPSVCVFSSPGEVGINLPLWLAL